MTYVVDSSVAVKVVLIEADSDKAQALFDQFAAGVHVLHSPDVFSVEVAHALTKAERQNRISVGEALALWSQVMATAPHFTPHRPLLPRAIEIASIHRIGVYDCLYVAFAEKLGFDFITADDRLVKNLRPTFPFIVPLSSLP